MLYISMEFRLGVEPKIRVRTKLRYTQYCVYTLVGCNLREKREKTKRSSKASRAKLKKHEIEERDKRQAATNIMYMLCNELNLSNI